jgi:hypothetical protein
LNRGPVDYESTALPTELPRLCVIHFSIVRKKLSNTGMEGDSRSDYRENGYISQPIPIATRRKARNDHKTYFARSGAFCFDRNANVTDTTNAKNASAWK